MNTNTNLHQSTALMMVKHGFSLGVIAISLSLAACAGLNQDSATVQRLCEMPDLSEVSQSEQLAGGYYALENNDMVCAERLTKSARSTNPKDPYAALNLGAIYQQSGRTEMAKASYQDVLRLDANSNTSADNTAGVSPREIVRRNLALLK